MKIVNKTNHVENWQCTTIPVQNKEAKRGKKGEESREEAKSTINTGTMNYSKEKTWKTSTKKRKKTQTKIDLN